MRTRTEWRIDLPWPKPPLGLNSIPSRFVLARAKRQIVHDVFWTARAAQLPKNLAKVRVELHWVPGMTRRRDTDNPSLTLKPCLDALVQYGLTTDDDSEHVESACVIDPVDRSNRRSRVYLLITDLTERG
jgi:Holliday junction resolvase RusA-like endonuclease